MSRRDTIIIAVLVNAGLLVVLFTTALKSNNSEPEIAANAALQPPKVTELPIPKEASSLPKVEGDQALNQFAATAAPASSSPTIPGVEKKEGAEQITAVPNFADDLKAFTLPEQPTAFAPASPASLPVDAALPLVNEKPQPQFAEVKVKKGDVLEKIARVNHTSVDEIMKANHLANSRLKIGQVLKIPSKRSGKTGEGNKTGSVAKVADAATKYYTVKNGDSPWTIAVKNHMKVEELLKLNNLNEEKARRLKAGDQLRIK